jgi:hypothetical protein
MARIITITDMTRAEVEDYLKTRDGDQCMFPGCERPLDDPNDINTFDHIFPQYLARAAGWTSMQIHSLDNVQLMHKRCNAIKGHQLPDENGNFIVPVREPKPVRGPRPEICDTCYSGRILNLGETCPDCGIGPQPARYPGSLQRKPKECDHSTYHCWMCVVDNPGLRQSAISRIITGP